MAAGFDHEIAERSVLGVERVGVAGVDHSIVVDHAARYVGAAVMLLTDEALVAGKFLGRHDVNSTDRSRTEVPLDGGPVGRPRGAGGRSRFPVLRDTGPREPASGAIFSHAEMVVLRGYEASDRERCLALFDTTAERYFSDGDREEFADFLDSGLASYFVVETEDGEVLGCGGFGLRDGRAVLTWGIVGAEFHGRGVGKFLLDGRISRIRALGSVSVVEMNTSDETVGFFTKAGFKVTSHVKDGYRPGLDRYDLELRVR